LIAVYIGGIPLSPDSDGEESDEKSEVLEESPCIP
jgi:hypothetical protein